MRKYIIIGLNCLVLFVSLGQTRAQVGGAISGYVTNRETGEALPGVNVVVEGTKFGAATDERGFYVIKHLPPGRYTLTARMIGYSQATESNIVVTPDDTTGADFRLSVEAIKFAEIVVTATRSNKLIADVPASTEVLSRAELRNGNFQNVGEALEFVQGVFIKNYGDLGGIKTVSIRGSSEGQVLVLLDGQRLNLPQGGGVDFSDIPLNAVERIEIVRGGNSALYGADAIGGVINIITTTLGLRKNFSGSLKSIVGSFGTKGYELFGSQALNRLSYCFSYNRMESDGDYEYSNIEGITQKRKNNRLKWDNLFLKLGYEFDKNSHLSFFTQYHKTKKGDPGAITWETPRAKRQWNRKAYNLTFDKKIENGPDLKIVTYFNQFEQKYKDPAAWIPVDSKHKNNFYGAELQSRIHLTPRVIFTYGYEFRHDELESSDVGKRKRNTTSVFLQGEMKATPSIRGLLAEISLIPAVRYDRYSDLGSELTPKVAFMITGKRGGQLSLRGNLGQSFRVPAFFDLYWPEEIWAVGNPNLKPEYGSNYDVGLVFQYPRAGFWAGEVTYFVNDLRDLIMWIPREDGKWTPRNVSKSLTRGVESKLLWSGFKDFINVELSYTYMIARNNSDDSPEKGKLLIYRPKHKFDGNLGLSYKFCRFNVIYGYVGKRFVTTDNQTSLPGYRRIDLNLGFVYPIADMKIESKLEVNNVLDKRIQVINSYPIPGREIRLALELTY